PAQPAPKVRWVPPERKGRRYRSRAPGAISRLTPPATPCSTTDRVMSVYLAETSGTRLLGARRGRFWRNKAQQGPPARPGSRVPREPPARPALRASKAPPAPPVRPARRGPLDPQDPRDHPYRSRAPGVI